MGAFGFGLPSLSVGNGNGAGFTFGSSAFPTTSPAHPSSVPVIASPTIDTEDGIGALLGSLASTGLDAYKTYSQIDLLNSQVNKGQAPSIVTGPNGTPSAPYSSTTTTSPLGSTTSFASGGAAATAGSTWIVYAVIALLLLFKR